LARWLDPGLTGEDSAYAGLRLDRMDDLAFAEIGLSQRDVAVLRDRFAAWPRDARTADQEPELGYPARDKPESGTGDPHPDSRRQHQPGHEPAAQAERDEPEAEP
jgi:hypothetical protein